MIYVAVRRKDINTIIKLISRKTQQVPKPVIIPTSVNEVKEQIIKESNETASDSSTKSINLKSFSDLTKFKLSQYNTLAAYSTYLYYAPSFMIYDSLIFLTATQLISMSSQAYNQV